MIRFFEVLTLSSRPWVYPGPLLPLCLDDDAARREGDLALMGKSRRRRRQGKAYTTTPSPPRSSPSKKKGEASGEKADDEGELGLAGRERGVSEWMRIGRKLQITGADEEWRAEEEGAESRPASPMSDSSARRRAGRNGHGAPGVGSSEEEEELLFEVDFSFEGYDARLNDVLEGAEASRSIILSFFLPLSLDLLPLSPALPIPSSPPLLLFSSSSSPPHPPPLLLSSTPPLLLPPPSPAVSTFLDGASRHHSPTVNSPSPSTFPPL